MPLILVAEDDYLLRTTLCDELREAGYEVTEASTGVEALEQVQARRPDVILLDLMMPVLDGWSFVQSTRNDPVARDIPIIVMSAVPALFDSTKTLPVRKVISKPFDLPSLMREVKHLSAP